jgi:hypothetical protein
VTNRNTTTVAIVGAGIGGHYLAAELGIAGFRLRLHDIDDTRLSEIGARGGVDVEGERGGFAPIERATTDLEAAVDGAEVIIVVTGGNAPAAVARSLAPLCDPFNPGQYRGLADRAPSPGRRRLPSRGRCCRAFTMMRLFQSAPPCRGRHRYQDRQDLQSMFQSAPPREGR